MTRIERGKSPTLRLGRGNIPIKPASKYTFCKLLGALSPDSHDATSNRFVERYFMMFRILPLSLRNLREKISLVHITKGQKEAFSRSYGAATYNIYVLPPNLLAKLIGETQLLGKTFPAYLLFSFFRSKWILSELQYAQYCSTTKVQFH